VHDLSNALIESTNTKLRACWPASPTGSRSPSTWSPWRCSTAAAAARHCRGGS